MVIETNLSVLITNIVSECNYSNCRLCLKDLRAPNGGNANNFVRFNDYIPIDGNNEEVLALASILTSFLNSEICEEVAGIDAVCIDCAKEAKQAFLFIKKCYQSTNLLNNICNNLLDTLNVDIAPSKGQSLYITVKEDTTEAILKEKFHHKTPKAVTKKTHSTTFFCSDCTDSNGKFKLFENFQDLKLHNLEVHAILTCEKCLGTYPDDNALLFHECIQKCAECKFKGHENSLQYHIQEAHLIHVCAECGKFCRGAEKLKRHEESHSSKNECLKCGKTYITKDFYNKHIKLCLEDQIEKHPYRSSIKKTYVCSKCPKGYSTPGGLRVHERFSHENAMPHICDICGKAFTAPSYLKSHMIKHTGQKNFKCDICCNRFVTKEALLYHTRRHTGEKPYSCKLCNEKFVNASARAEHIKFKHKEPKLQCSICQRKFYTRSFLKAHMSKHHDPSSQLYCQRNTIPANVPGPSNMRIKVDIVRQSNMTQELILNDIL